MKTDIKALSYDSINSLIKNLSQPSFRAKQIFAWLHKFGVDSFDEMSNLPKALREKLCENYYISSCKIEKKLVSKTDGTVKYLFSLSDGEYVESVIMKYKYGYTICVSSQVGCKMGCRFLCVNACRFCKKFNRR